MPTGVPGDPTADSRSPLELANGLLLGVIVAGSMAAWRHLPERIPKHMNAHGVVDAWTDKSLWSWFLLPGVAVLMYVLLRLSSRLMVRRPELVNLPAKARFLRLPREEQLPILRRLEAFLQLFTTLMLLMLGLIQLAMYRAALGAPAQTLANAVLLTIGILMPVLAIILMLQLTSRINEAHQRAERRGTLVRK